MFTISFIVIIIISSNSISMSIRISVSVSISIIILMTHCCDSLLSKITKSFTVLIINHSVVINVQVLMSF